MAIDYTDFKNDTARMNGARKFILESIFPKMQEIFEGENVRFIKKKLVILADETNPDSTVEIPPNTICVCTGQTKAKDGSTADVVAEISVKIKSFNTTTDKNGKTKWAVNFDAITEALEQE